MNTEQGPDIISEHLWTTEIQRFAVTGKLCESRQAHVRDCGACQAALADARGEEQPGDDPVVNWNLWKIIKEVSKKMAAQETPSKQASGTRMPDLFKNFN